MGGGNAQQVISTNPPVQTYVEHPMCKSSFWGSFAAVDGPLPTNEFWQNLVLDTGTNPVGVHPYVVNVSSSGLTGLTVCFPSITVSSVAVVCAQLQNLVLGAAGAAYETHSITAFDEMSVTVEVQLSGGTLSCPLVRGCPYVSAKYSGLTPQLQTTHAIMSINGSGDETSTFWSDRFIIELNNDQTWMVFFDEAVELVWSGSTITAQSSYSGWTRVALAPTEDTQDILGAYKSCVPVGGTVSYTKTASNSVDVIFEWETQSTDSSESDPALLMTTLPHHRQILSSLSPSSQLADLTYTTLRGQMTGILGVQWMLTLALTPLSSSFTAPREIASERVEDVRAALMEDISFNPGPGYDPYFAGKAFAKLGRLVLVAEELGETEAAATAREALKESMETWISGTNSDPLLYDITYGGICSTNGLKDPGADFGNGYYNDQHFHYGYFLYAAAVIAKGDVEWLNSNAQGASTSRLEFFLTLVRSMANSSSSDTYFPKWRYLDWYEGHSWATGMFGNPNGKNQESSSEATNAWYGVSLLGLASGSEDLQTMGQVLLGMEILSVHTYWHMKPDSVVYPLDTEQVFNANTVVGICWQTKCDYTTFFGNSPEYIHCIQMLPFTPITEELLPADWVSVEYSVLDTTRSPSTPQEWLGFVYMDHAIIDPAAAWEEIRTLTAFDDGNSKTNTMYWVATRPSTSSDLHG